MNNLLREKMKELGWEETDMVALVQDVVTRWNSTADMLERFVRLEEPIKKVLEDDNFRKSMKNKATGIKFSSSDWKVMKNLVSVLKPFKEAIEAVSKSDACVSMSIPTVSSILLTLEPSWTERDSGVKDLKARLKKNMENRTAGMERNTTYSVATLLDARYKGYLFRESVAREEAERKLVELLKNEIEYIPAEVVIEDEPIYLDNLNPEKPPLSALASAFERFHKKSDENLANKVIGTDAETPEYLVKSLVSAPCEKSGNLKWWEKFEAKANATNDNRRLALCNIAKQYLTPPPSSVNVERLFSSAGQVMDEKRANLKPEIVDKILFLRENSIVNNFKLDW